jgi:membrane dipeptidase
MRLIDLHCNWALQYACETSQYDPALYSDTRERLRQVDGYLSETSVSVLTCGRRAADWALHRNPWSTLADMIARYEAEFSGRLLLGPDDVHRWRSEPKGGICWGMLGVEGFDFLVRENADLDRLPALFERGVRVFQLVEARSSKLGGSAEPGDDRGLTVLGRDFLDCLLDLAPPAGQPGPRPVVDIADMSTAGALHVLEWFEADSSRKERLSLLRSHSGLTGPLANVARFRAIGGVIGLSVGPPHFSSADELRRAIDLLASNTFDGREGFEGIGIGTDALNLTSSVDGLDNVSRITAWLSETLGPEPAQLIACGNATGFVEKAVGGVPRRP